MQRTAQNARIVVSCHGSVFIFIRKTDKNARIVISCHGSVFIFKGQVYAPTVFNVL